MLIKITGNCNGNCPHCMDRCIPGNDQMMSEETFDNILRLFKNVHFVLNISGGEPTLHPNLLKLLSKITQPRFVTLISNGSFLLDPEKTKMVEKAIDLKYINYVQITCIKELYPNYEQLYPIITDYIGNGKYREKFIFSSDDKVIKMIDRGRASDNIAIYVDRIKKDKAAPSCLKTVLSARQSDRYGTMATILNIQQGFCKPSVSWNGDIIMSECSTCPSIGNVNKIDSLDEVYNRMKAFIPCGACLNYDLFMSSNDEKTKEVREFINKITKQYENQEQPNR